MTIRTCHRDQCPGSWYVGRRVIFAGVVWELAEIEGTAYHWIKLRDRLPGDTQENINDDTRIPDKPLRREAAPDCRRSG